MMKLFLIFLFVINLVHADGEEQTSCSSNGLWSSNWTHQVSFEYKGQRVCSGSVVSDYYVVTVAQCFDNRDYKDMKIYVDQKTAEDWNKVHEIAELITYIDYKTEEERSINEVAMVRVERPFNLKGLPNFLLKSGEEIKPGVCTISSSTWYNVASEDPFGVHFNKTGVIVTDEQTCDDAFALSGGLGFGQICVEKPMNVPCYMNIGDPLTLEGRLAGLYSWGDPHCGSLGPAVYASIPYWRDWIDAWVL